MPIVPYELDATGFDVPTQAEPIIPEPKKQVSPYAFAGPAVSAVADVIAATPAVVSAAVRQENDVYNGIQMLTEPHWEYDPNFNLVANLKESGLWDSPYRDNFLGVVSPAQYLYKLRKIEQEKADKELLQSSGIGGLVASIASGIASPTILLPFIGEAKGVVKAAAIGGAWAFAGGLAQEIPLQLNQELRTLEDSAVSVGLSTLLGIGLGGAVGFAGKTIERLSTDMAPVQRAGAIPISEEHPQLQVKLEKVMQQMDNIAPDDAKGLEPLVAESERLQRRMRDIEDELATRTAAEERDLAISESAIGKGAGVGADIRQLDAGGLKGMLGIGEKLTRVAGPVTSVLGQKVSVVGRRMMASLSTAGLRLEGNMVLNSKGEIAGMVPSGRTSLGDFGMAEGSINARKGDLFMLRQTAYGHYADYFYGEGAGPKNLRQTRAGVSGQLNKRSSGKLSRAQFFEEVSTAMWNGRVHDVPEVQKVAEEFGAYQDQLLKEAQDLGLISQDIKDVTGDLGFLNRVYNIPEINKNPLGFLKTLSEHFEQALQGDARNIRERFAISDAKDAQRLEDAFVPLDVAQKMREDFKKELDALNSLDDEDLGPVEDLIKGYGSEAAKLSRQKTQLEKQLKGLTRKADRDPVQAQLDKVVAERKIYSDEIVRLRSLGGADLEARAARRAELKRRMRNLNRGRFMVEEKARKKFDLMNKLEEDNLEAMERVVNAARTAMKATEKVGADVDAELKKLHTAVKSAEQNSAKLAEQIDSLNEQAAKSAAKKAGPEADVIDNADAKIIAKIWTKNAKFEEVRADFEDASTNLADWQNINWVERGLDEVHATIQDTLDRAVRRVAEANTNRAKRMAKLEKDATFDEKAWQGHIDEIKARMIARKQKAHDKLESLGDINHNDLTGVGDFKLRAGEIASIAKQRITGANMRLPGFDMMQDARGTELARTLSVPSLALAKDNFLITDAEQLMEAYQNTLVPDIEIVKRLGEFAPDGEKNLMFKELNEEEENTIRRLRATMEEEARKKGKPFDLEANRKANDDIRKEYKVIKSNLNAVISRLRNQWGLPGDPESWGNRAANVVLQTQAWRLLGGVLVAQASDVARPIMRYGVRRTFKTAFNLLFNDKDLKQLAFKDAQRAYVAVETQQAEISHQLAGILASSQRKGTIEASMTWATSKLGILFGFAPWTDVMKTLSAATMNMKLMDSIDLAINEVGNSKARQEAIGYLNSLGLNEDMQRNIWDEMNNGGAIQHQGTWVPRTDAWENLDTVRAYRAALNRESGATVVTPGVELPKIANANPALRLLFHLKSFALASTSKTLMAGLQQRDMAVMNGVLISLALGYVSYYLRSVIAGGDAQARMENATWEQRVDEAINASGILGAIQLAQQIADDVPFLRNVSSLNGISSMAQNKPNEQSLRSSGGGLVEDVMGPTAGLAFTLATVITGLEKPSRSTVHKVRQLLPLQNYVFLRRLFDQVENATGDTFHLKGQRR